MAVTPRRFRALALVNLAALALIVVSGAAVRLTGSGLGCPDWPNCSGHEVVAALGQTHALIEDANRGVTGIVIALAGLMTLAALLRRPRRRDLVALSAGLVGGIVADALLGALVVYSKLNPWLVSGHLALSLGMVVLGGVIVHRCSLDYAPSARAETRSGWSRQFARWLWVPFCAVLATGMVTTGSGPHSGASAGQLVARRLPFPLQSAAWVHSVAATLFLGIVATAAFVLWQTGAPHQVLIGVQRLLAVGVLQGVIGVAQYATRLPVALVELHVVGAVSLVYGVLQFQLRQVARDPEPSLTDHAVTMPNEASLVAS